MKRLDKKKSKRMEKREEMEESRIRKQGKGKTKGCSENGWVVTKFRRV